MRLECRLHPLHSMSWVQFLNFIFDLAMIFNSGVWWMPWTRSRMWTRMHQYSWRLFLFMQNRLWTSLRWAKMWECMWRNHWHGEWYNHESLLPRYIPKQQELYLGDHCPTTMENYHQFHTFWYRGQQPGRKASCNSANQWKYNIKYKSYQSKATNILNSKWKGNFWKYISVSNNQRPFRLGLWQIAYLITGLWIW